MSWILTILMAMTFMAVERSKTRKALSLLEDGKIREALAIFRSFRIGFSKEEKRTIQIASDTLNGSGLFYEKLGIDTYLETEKAINIIHRKYLQDKG